MKDFTIIFKDHDKVRGQELKRTYVQTDLNTFKCTDSLYKDKIKGIKTWKQDGEKGKTYQKNVLLEDTNLNIEFALRKGDTVSINGQKIKDMEVAEVFMSWLSR